MSAVNASACEPRPVSRASTTTLRLALPKGRMQEGVFRLLGDAGIRVSLSSRGYRPSVSLPGFEAKILKPQNIIEMLDSGTRDLGFAGADWVRELRADLVEVLDTGLDAVRLVAAAPPEVLVGGRLPARPLAIASEYARLAGEFIDARAQGDRFVRSFGATEVFPPEDADCVIDIAASGATLEANNLRVCDELMISSTRLYASRDAMRDPVRRRSIDDFAMLVRSVLEARRRVMLELNAPAASLDAIIAALPCMRQPTLSRLAGDAGFAVKSAVPRETLPGLIPLLKQLGGCDIVISPLSQVVA